MGSWENIKANVAAKYKASGEARRVYTEELRTARIREAKILANQRATIERKQKVARLMRRPQTIGRALGFTRQLGTRARGGAARTLGVQNRRMPSKAIKRATKRGKIKIKRLRRRSRMKNNSYNNGYDNDYGMGGFGFG